MGVTALIDKPERPGVSRRARVGFWWLSLSALLIAVFAPLPYLTTSLRALADNDNNLAFDRPTTWSRSWPGVPNLLVAEYVLRLRSRSTAEV